MATEMQLYCLRTSGVEKPFSILRSIGNAKRWVSAGVCGGLCGCGRHRPEKRAISKSPNQMAFDVCNNVENSCGTIAAQAYRLCWFPRTIDCIGEKVLERGHRFDIATVLDFEVLSVVYKQFSI